MKVNNKDLHGYPSFTDLFYYCVLNYVAWKIKIKPYSKTYFYNFSVRFNR